MEDTLKFLAITSTTSDRAETGYKPQPPREEQSFNNIINSAIKQKAQKIP